MDHHFYMSIALKEALKAKKEGEVPVGAVIVKNNQILSQAHNRKEQDQSALSHAEILAVRGACSQLNSWRLNDCSIYITLEPCLMCAGAIAESRIKQLVYACKDPKIGAVHSHWNVFSNYKINIVSGIMEEMCSNLIKKFFQNLR